MKLIGADAIMECLLEQGVDTVFGYPGGNILDIYNSIYKYSDKIRHITTAHEEGAAHAADGYARSTGKVGVCFATSGPGATNLVTGIATAYMDSVPLVAITCNVSTSLLGKDSFQEVDIVGITLPITKHSFLIKHGDDIASTIRRAFEIALSGRPGPVLIDITKDATCEEVDFKRILPKIKNDNKALSKADIKKAATLIKKAKRPLLYTGGGIISSGASESLKKLQKLIDAPITLSLMGLGGFPASDDAYTGLIGMHGSQASSFAVSNCDLLIAIGVRFSERVICDSSVFAKNAKIIHIDADPAEINKNIPVTLGIAGDAKSVIDKLCENLTPMSHKDWINQVNTWKKAEIKADDLKLTPKTVFDIIHSETDDDTFICTDVGQHQVWTAQYLPIEKPRHFISSGGLGTMGFGLGAAIGVKLANPKSLVINITGDGCFHMNANELSTAAEQKLPIIEIMFNNRALGMVRQWQKIFYNANYSHTSIDKSTDYEMVAKGFGAKAYTVRSGEEFRKAFRLAAKEKETPTLINCIIDKDEAVLPMVPSGESIENPILKIKGEKKK